MNLILLFKNDFISDTVVKINDRRFEHLKTIHSPQLGQNFKVGLLNGKKGNGLVTELSNNHITLDVFLDQSPPPSLPATLLLALPRPKMLKRILQTTTAMGVKELYLINSYRVDKSYWSSPVLSSQIEENLLLGLEQAGDTILPKVHIRKRFKPFIEDELPEIAENTKRYVAHPYNAEPCPSESSEPATIAIGPEGGFIEYEIEKLKECGFTPIHIGQRILRVENAVPAVLSKLFPFS